MIESSQKPLERSEIGRYRLRYHVARGGMASVYLAQLNGPHAFQKWVAIKLIHEHLAKDDRFVSMFLDEARVNARINHPNVCQVVDFGIDNKLPYLVMEYMHGESLVAVLKKAVQIQRLPRPLFARTVADAARGLHAAHELVGPDGRSLEIVHRDVSPQNIFVLYDGITKVLDFGVVHARGRETETRSGTLKGKLAYMAPEQLRRGAIDRRADVWSLGVVLWESTLGRRLFRAPDDASTMMLVVEQPIPDPREIDPSYPDALAQIVMSALERDPNKRMGTALELADGVERYLYSIGEPAGPRQVANWIGEQFSERRAQREALLRENAAVVPPPVESPETSSVGFRDPDKVALDASIDSTQVDKDSPGTPQDWDDVSVPADIQPITLSGEYQAPVPEHLGDTSQDKTAAESDPPAASGPISPLMSGKAKGTLLGLGSLKRSDIFDDVTAQAGKKHMGLGPMNPSIDDLGATMPDDSLARRDPTGGIRRDPTGPLARRDPTGAAALPPRREPTGSIPSLGALGPPKSRALLKTGPPVRLPGAVASAPYTPPTNREGYSSEFRGMNRNRVLSPSEFFEADPNAPPPLPDPETSRLPAIDVELDPIAPPSGESIESAMGIDVEVDMPPIASPVREPTSITPRYDEEEQNKGGGFFWLWAGLALVLLLLGVGLAAYLGSGDGDGETIASDSTNQNEGTQTGMANTSSMSTTSDSAMSGSEMTDTPSAMSDGPAPVTPLPSMEPSMAEPSTDEPSTDSSMTPGESEDEPDEPVAQATPMMTPRMRGPTMMRTAGTPAPVRGRGRIAVFADPAGTVVFEGRVLGQTPLRATSVPAGEHRVLVRSGGQIRSQRVVIRPNKTTSVSFR